MAFGGGGSAPGLSTVGAPDAGTRGVPLEPGDSDGGDGVRNNTAASSGTWTIAGPRSAVCASFALTVFTRTGVTASWTSTALADSAARGSRLALAKGALATDRQRRF